MAAENDEYIYDEVTGEWRPASEMAASASGVRRSFETQAAIFLPMATRSPSSRI
ncbi:MULTISPECIES: hypothetical protein [Rhizobium]|uniref:hypothetical protein n=1 Tax=Rhizobium TaxID=379 RepID=UPI001820BB32|nr:hypothetical protein [Rhizobium sp. BK112]MBB3367267.1 hypothetical protein [Rhizobium sp. BK077]MBB4178717.1 hypothetical protein [Rhizobium sp. BK109]MBB4213835.1 hypothetical protein [Rhizobium sp. BK212]